MAFKLRDRAVSELIIIEQAVLEYVNVAVDSESYVSSPSGRRTPVTQSYKRELRINNSWKETQKCIKQALEQSVLPYSKSVQIDKLIKSVTDAVKRRIGTNARAINKGIIRERYKEPFSELKCKLKELNMATTIDPNTRFIDNNKEVFRTFCEKYKGRLNIFIAINYGDDDKNELSLIRRILEAIERNHPKKPKFHYAEDQDLLPDLLENLQFYLLACKAAIIFFTESNFSERRVAHNPNVVYELGFLHGIRNPCHLIVQHKNIHIFTDIKGLIRQYYSNPNDTEAIINKFIDNLESKPCRDICATINN